MKTSYIPLALLISLLLTACGSNTSETVQEEKTTTTLPVFRDSVLTPNFYKRLEGTVAGQPVVVHLQSVNGTLSGIYYYLSQGKWLLLNGTLDAGDPNKVMLTETSTDNGEASGTLECSYAQGTFKGSWRNPDGTKNYVIDLREAYPEGTYTFTTLSLEDSVPAFPGKAGSPVARTSSEFVLPLQTDEAGQWLGSRIGKAMHTDTTQPLDLAAAVQREHNQYLQSYKEETKGMGADEQFTSFLNYEDLQHVTVCYNDNGYVILSSEVYSYTGGAHGNGGISFYCLDVRNRKELQLRDVISADSARLQPIVEAAFRRQQGLQPADSLNTILFENHLATTQNFYFSSKGLGFYYFPYEVAAYAVGPIQVFVPYDALKAYLKPDFAARLKLQ